MEVVAYFPPDSTEPVPALVTAQTDREDGNPVLAVVYVDTSIAGDEFGNALARRVNVYHHSEAEEGQGSYGTLDEFGSDGSLYAVQEDEPPDWWSGSDTETLDTLPDGVTFADINDDEGDPNNPSDTELMMGRQEGPEQ